MAAQCLPTTCLFSGSIRQAHLHPVLISGRPTRGANNNQLTTTSLSSAFTYRPAAPTCPRPSRADERLAAVASYPRPRCAPWRVQTTSFSARSTSSSAPIPHPTRFCASFQQPARTTARFKARMILSVPTLSYSKTSSGDCALLAAALFFTDFRCREFLASEGAHVDDTRLNKLVVSLELTDVAVLSSRGEPPCLVRRRVLNTTRH